MADNHDIMLMAHLMRRAGFGASYEEIERRAALGYAETVEELLYPETQPDLEMDVLNRYMHGWRDLQGLMANQGYWTYRMVNSPRQLEEKICLFWHGIFCVGDSKCMRARQILLELNNFRSHGLGKFDNLLMYLSTDPAMLYYLDNQLSHKDAVNENWGRELLELFSMGVGMDGQANYSEDDVKACAQAFTGWTIANAIPRYPYGSYANRFLYNRFDHIEDDKTFLGETGNWNGEDVIRIICKQTATARFVARHLYNFFVADEPQVPAWQHTPPRDPELIKALEDAYFSSGSKSAPCSGCCSTPTASRTPASPKSKTPAKWSAAPSASSATSPPPSRGCTTRPSKSAIWARICSTRPPWRVGIPAKSGLTAVPWWSGSTTPPVKWAAPTPPASAPSSTASSPAAPPFPTPNSSTAASNSSAATP